MRSMSATVVHVKSESRSRPPGPTAHRRRTRAMTALQDWLSFRPVDQGAIVDMVFRPLRAVLGTQDADEARPEVKLITPGVERC